MVSIVNDGGAVSINIGGINPPSITTATTGINARPIIFNDPLAEEEPFFDEDEVISIPFILPDGSVTFLPASPVTDSPQTIGISDIEDGQVEFSPFPLFQFDDNSQQNNDINLDQILNLNQTQDVLIGTPEKENLNGGGGDDFLSGRPGNDQLNGGSEQDTLFGGQDNDTLNGGAGNDILSGDKGQDILSGGVGSDTFIVSLSSSTNDANQVDVITDFIVGEDFIGLSEGLSIIQIDLIPFNLFGSPGTLISHPASNTFLGFVSNVGVNNLWNSFIAVNPVE